MKLAKVDEEWFQREYTKPWPEWARRAGARSLQLIFPLTTTAEWEACWEGEERLERVMDLLGDGRVTGQFMRLCQSVPEALAEAPPGSVKGVHLETLQAQVLTLKEQIRSQMEQAMERPREEAADFFRKFAQAMEREGWIRVEDQRAFRVYVILMLNWPCVEKFRGRPLKCLYRWLRPWLGPVEVKGQEHWVDAKERHYKWFENLCERTLGLSLRARGHRARKARPRSIRK